VRRFITFEGIEGSGKTTQVQLLSNALEGRGVDHVLTREPGGTPIGDTIRALVLDPAHGNMTAACELLLYAAARAQHIDQVIRPALDGGSLVLCDRFTDATRAYQGFGRGLPMPFLERLFALEALALVPDRTLLFDIEPGTAIQRARDRDRSRGEPGTRFEQEDLPFHERVRAGYLELARREPARITVIDATGTVEAVQARVIQAVEMDT
jgi:dTMP kinase